MARGRSRPPRPPRGGAGERADSRPGSLITRGRGQVCNVQASTGGENMDGVEGGSDRETGRESGV